MPRPRASIWVIAATVTVTVTERETATSVTLIAIPTATGITVAVVTAIETSMAEIIGRRETGTGVTVEAHLIARGTLLTVTTGAGGAPLEHPHLAALPGIMTPLLCLQPTATGLVGKGFFAKPTFFSRASPFYVIFVIFLT